MAYAGEDYDVYTSDNKYVYNYPSGETTVKDESQLEEERRTDDYGQFTLKAGQKAKFSGLTPGDNYEISEASQELFQIQSPASGKIISTLTKDGATEVFENLYTVGKPGTLIIRKSISYPENFALPQSSFKFKVRIDNKDYANKSFVVRDGKTKNKIREGETDDEGCLELAGDTYAVFADVPIDKDYSVEEMLTDEQQQEGWRTVGNNKREGATEDTGTDLMFVNVVASFMVNKSIANIDATDETFTFQVTKPNGNDPYGVVAYYLYDKNHQLIDEEDPVKHTDGNGIFTLQAGQTAIFLGLAAGEDYGIKEVDSGSLVNTLPADGAYINKTVGDSVESMPFVNSGITDKNALAVKKTVVNNTDGKKVPNDLFTFQISVKEQGEDGEVRYTPLENAPFDIQTAEGTKEYETDGEGVFSIHAGETAYFIDLKKEWTYQVKEIEGKLPRGYSVEQGEGEAEITDNEPAVIEIKNIYNGRLFPFVGGKGIMMFIIIGLALLAAGCYIFRDQLGKLRRGDAHTGN